MDRAEITHLVNKAIARLVKNEPQLLALNVTERALSHHFAPYLGEMMPEGFNVDCEYNRHFDDPKRLNLKRRQTKDREIRATTVCSQTSSFINETRTQTIYLCLR